MIYNVVTATGEREINIDWPDHVRTIGILLSGGIDSALLLWMYAQIIPSDKHKIIVLYADRGDEVNWQSAQQIVSKINSDLSTDIKIEFIPIPHKSIDFPLQTAAAGIVALKRKLCNILISGDTSNPPVHIEGPGEPKRLSVDRQFSIEGWELPFLHIDKSHTVSLVNQHIPWAFELSRTCIARENVASRCSRCWQCNERSWGFEQNKLLDNGLL